MTVTLVAAAYDDVIPMSPILVTRDADGDMMMDGIPTVSIDEVCSRAYDPPRFCQGDVRLPIEVSCHTIVEAGYIPKGCDGAYMLPRDRRDYCDTLKRAGQAEPHYCFAHNDMMRSSNRRARYRGIDFGTGRGKTGNTIIKHNQGRLAADNPNGPGK